MGDFIKAIRNGEVVSPLRADFDLRAWFDAGQLRDGVDLPDLQLVLAGYLFDQKFRHLRSNFEKLELADCCGEALRQAYVAIANRGLVALHRKMHETMRESAAKQGTLYMDEMLSMKVETLNGCSYSVDEPRVRAVASDG